MAVSREASDRAFYAALGARVRTLREERSWTQEQLAQALEIEPATLSRYETARRPFPLEVLRGVASHLKVPLVALMPGVSDDLPPPGTTRLEDSPLTARDAEVLTLWHRIPAPRRKLALDVLRTFAAPVSTPPDR